MSNTPEKKVERGSVKSYSLGLLLCLLLTLAAYSLVVKHLLTGPTLIFAVIGLALLQAIVQLLLFLHVGDEPKPYWNLMVFLFMLLVVVILVFGSLWIMYNLDYRTMGMM